MKKKNQTTKQQNKRRESPQDFMLAFLAWQKRNPERKLTAKGYAILRAVEKEKS